MISERESFDRFLMSLETTYPIGVEMAGHIRSWWMVLSKRFSERFPLPMADITADMERFQFAWSYASIYFEAEVDKKGNLEWFGKNRHTDEADSGEFNLSFPDLEPMFVWMNKLIY